MTTDLAPVSSRRSHYWQLPLFAIGLIAAGLAYANFPPQPATPAERFARNVKSLKSALDRRPVDAAMLDGLAIGVVAELTPDTEDYETVCGLCGSAFVAAAEADPSRIDRWTQASELFAKSKPEQIADPQRKKLILFRQAKALAAIEQGDPKSIVAALVDVPVGEESEGERRRLLAETFLRMTPPNLKMAQAEFTAYLAGPTRRPAAQLAKDRHGLAQLCMALGEPEKARAVLKDIGAGAPPEVLADAKIQLARLAGAENNWKDAVAQFEAVLSNPATPADRKPTAMLQLADAYRKAGTPEAARPLLEQVASGTGPAAQSANFHLAELLLNQPASPAGRGNIVDILQAAERANPGGREADASSPTLDRIRDIFERTIQTSSSEGDFASAVRAATIYASCAVPGRATERKAEAHTAWAELLTRDPATAPQAAEKYREAAADYASLAATFPTSAGQAEFWKRSAHCHRLGGDEASAAATLDRLTQTPGFPEDVVAAAWVEKGESLLAGRRFDEGSAALRQAMLKTSPTAASARVKLAVAYLDDARLKAKEPATQAEAMTQLKNGQDLLLAAVAAPAETPVEIEARNLATFELGKFLLNQNNVADAEARFRQVIQARPGDKLLGQTKLYLGSTLLVAARGDQAGRPPADAETKLTEAAKLFTELSDGPESPLRAQADIRLANTTLLLRKYADMPELCERLAGRYTGKVEELIIRSMLYTAYRFADRTEPAATTLARMEDLFLRLPDEAFPGGADEYTRDYWRKQWFAPLKAKP